MGVQKTHTKDYLIHDVFPPAVYASILPELVNHGIRWVGDIANTTGTSVWNGNGLQTHAPVVEHP